MMKRLKARRTTLFVLTMAGTVAGVVCAGMGFMVNPAFYPFAAAFCAVSAGSGYLFLYG